MASVIGGAEPTPKVKFFKQFITEHLLNPYKAVFAPPSKELITAQTFLYAKNKFMVWWCP